MPAHDLFIYVEGENNILQKVWVGGVKSVIFYVNYRSTPLLPGVEHWINSDTLPVSCFLAIHQSPTTQGIVGNID